MKGGRARSTTTPEGTPGALGRGLNGSDHSTRGRRTRMTSVHAAEGIATVADNVARQEVDDILGDVGRVIGDTFEVA